MTVVSVCLLRMLIPLCVPSPYVINLLRNLAPKRGLVNGTRLIVVHLRERVIQAPILTGTHSGRLVLIPRIRCNPSDHDLPFELIRLHFPIRPAFAMFINKSQGQTFTKVGIYLPTFVFSHGQLYVAISRVGSEDGVLIMVAHQPPEGTSDLEGAYTYDVVYPEIFRLAEPDVV